MGGSEPSVDHKEGAHDGEGRHDEVLYGLPKALHRTERILAGGGPQALAEEARRQELAAINGSRGLQTSSKKNIGDSKACIKKHIRVSDEDSGHEPLISEDL